jgi:FMN phosphatase YigB (HAD superfamily)
VTSHRLLLLDFDGTLCLGDDPVLAYADQVDDLLEQRNQGSVRERTVREAVTAAFAQNVLLVEDIQYDAAGTPAAVSTDPAPSVGKAHPVSWPLQDGYQLVQLLATQSGLTNEETGHAFRQARRNLLARGLDSTDVHAPPEAAALLDEVRGSGLSAVLATNAPAEGFDVWLQALGLQNSFDAVINSAQKPFGMPQTLEQARCAGPHPVPQTEILSVGDIWANDLAHVDALGGATVLIDRFSTGLGDPDHRVWSFEQSAPIILRWAS